MTDTKISRNSVLARRQARKWSQAELAERVGISRAAVSAIEGERLSPSVATALELARVFECAVEELFGTSGAHVSGESEWAWLPRAESCRYWEANVHGKSRLYPVEAPGLNPTPHDGLWRDGVLRQSRESKAQSTLVMASCDPAAALLAAEYERESGFRLLVFPRGGHVALELLRKHLVHVAGLHYSTEERPDRNAEAARAAMDGNARLLRMARWDAGIALPAGDRSNSVESVAKRSICWAAREPGSSARECLDQVLGARTFHGREVDGHPAVAEAVRAGWAEAGVCVRFSAAEAGLNFLPVRAETLDLCFTENLQNDPRILALGRLLRSRSYRQLLSELPGYQARETGELLSL
jgi:molybdate-binding protein/DNA-binding XRE family transcriptional regulator